MPPGAKKRKALKKKQQQPQESTVTSSTNNKESTGDSFHEKGHDDRESDDSSLSSPASQGNGEFGGGTKDPSGLVKGTAKEISDHVTKGLGPNNGHDENGSQGDRESDGSYLSSPASQGNEEFGGTKDPSAFVNYTAKEISDLVTQGLGNGNGIAVERGTDDKKNIVEKSLISSSKKSTQTTKNVDSQDACVEEIAPVVDSVSKVVISKKTEHAVTSTHSNLVNKKSDGKKECQSPEKDNGEVANLPGSAAGTSKRVESLRESEAPVSPGERRLLLTGPPAVRTSWLSCCGLFDALTGSDR